MPTLNGHDVVLNPNLLIRVQYRFPRSKKRRIRKKWEKRFSILDPDPSIYLFGNRLAMHPETYRTIAGLLKDDVEPEAIA